MKPASRRPRAPPAPPRIGSVEPSTTARPITVVEQTNFAVSDDGGDMVPGSYHGFFAADTRFLSRFILRLDGSRLERLSAAVGEHQSATFYLANPRVAGLRAASVAVFRDRTIGRGLEERIRLISYRAEPIDLELSLELDSDFADIFEARGARRRRRRIVTTEHTERRTVFTYENSGYRRSTRVTFSRPMVVGERRRLTIDVTLERGRPWDLNLTVGTTRWSRRGVPPLPPERTIEPRQVRRWRDRLPLVRSSDARVERAWRQAGRDMVALLLSGPRGDFLPAAGVPWYLAVFGRDACITALQTQLLGPEIGQGTLRQLSAYQGTIEDPFREEEPGKIPHEVRTGELATLGSMPFSRYYGSSDATPLFVMVFVAACRAGGWLTNGRAPGPRARRLPAPLGEFLPAVERALGWIDAHTDADGLVRYRPHHQRGIMNQVWKDSWDSMRYRDGSIAVPPIAAVEVQGYVVAARRGMAEVYAALRRSDDALRHQAAADRTAEAVEATMWMPDEGTYALGLDEAGRQIDGVASNAGHLLWCGLPSRARAESVAARLMARDMFSGWGVRTLSNANPGYNPIGYHTGSVWPHDNSLIAAGMAAYGQHRAAWRVIDALLDAAAADPQARLPELYAGFDRRATPDLVPYPTACAPQAWATGALVLAVQTMLGRSPGRGRGRHLPGASALRLTPAADGQDMPRRRAAPSRPARATRR
jgi:glycogen debranching enzyme